MLGNNVSGTPEIAISVRTKDHYLFGFYGPFSIIQKLTIKTKFFNRIII